MENILSIDCSAQKCSLALNANGRNFVRESSEAQQHAKLLLPMLTALLNESAQELSSLDGICLTVGPGSFTGIRIGVAAVQGLAFGAGIPVYPFSSLEILAYSACLALANSSRRLDDALVVASMDARMGERYRACYRSSECDGRLLLKTVDAPAISTDAEFSRLLHNLSHQQRVLLAGDIFASEDAARNAPWEYVEMQRPLAEAMLLLFSAIRETNGQREAVKDPAMLQPLYLRKQLTWKKREKIRQTDYSSDI